MIRIESLVIEEFRGIHRLKLIKYVITPPGERSKEVQALLRLERIEKLRQSLQTVVNSCKNETKRLDDEITRTESNLLRALGITRLKKEDVLTAVNAKRA